MSNQTAERESSLIGGEELDTRVECLTSVLQQIRETVLEGANRHHPVRFEVRGELFGKDLDINCRLPFGPKEVHVRGVLFGERERGRVRILAFRPLVSAQAPGRAGKLLEPDRQALVALIATARTNEELHGLEPVGWARAHPKSELTLSRQDREVFDYFFNEPWQIGLMLRPTGSPPTRAKCFFRDIDGSIRAVRNFQEVSCTLVDDAMPLAESLAPPSAMQRMSAGAAPLPWQPPRAPARATPIWPAALLLSTVLSLGYWWMQSSQQEPFQNPYRHPAAGTGSDPRKKPEQEAAALWKKWEEELRRKQEVAALRDRLEREAVPRKPEAVPSRPLKPPVPVGPARPARSERLRSPLRRPFAPPARKVASRPLPPPQRPPAASTHLKQLSPAPPVATPAPTRPAVDSPPTTPVAASVPPPQKKAPDASVPQQSVALQALPATMPHQEQSSSGTVISKRPPASFLSNSQAGPATASAAPSFGRLIWTGRLPKNGTLVIDGARPSTGSVTGELPGRPVRFSVWRGDLRDDGIVLYTSSKQATSALESPGPQNGWNKTVYMPDKHHSADIAVMGLPAANNSWKRLVLRSKSPTSVILVEWTLIP
jgi:hypothetical protein